MNKNHPKIAPYGKITSTEKQCRVGSLDLRKIFFLQGGQLYSGTAPFLKKEKGRKDNFR
jgi:hypothetical protein